MIRSFIAIELNEDIKKELGLLIEDLKPLAQDLKWVRPENLHITLKFLGGVEEKKIEKIKQALEETVKPYKPFTVKIKGIGQFPEKKMPRVIWAGVEHSETLLLLQRETEKSLLKLGFKKEEREFTGHITIARLKNHHDIKKLLNKLPDFKDKDFGIQEVNEIVLMKSELRPEGARYEIIARFAIGN
ncbi:MAG: RNA 2',3'-cyclic phosphodiesterase [Thermodesulfovibrionales bacterium]|nr:RNA 2',3'-cyclic phosphodiesterase [Thermodesulfovibrionales bacterium]